MTVGGKNTEVFKGEVEREFQKGIRDTVTGEVTLNINGVTITISEDGRVSVKAKEIILSGSSQTVIF